MSKSLKSKNRKVAWMSDIHFPYENTKHLNIALDFVADYKPDVIVLGGDIYDFYPSSRFHKDPRRKMSIQDEIDSARWFIDCVNELAAQVVFVEGNHEHRFRRAVSEAPGLYDLRSLDLNNVLDLPKSWTFIPNQSWWTYGGVLWLHGDIRGVSERVINPAAAMLRWLRHTFVCGHFHRPSVAYQNDFNGLPDMGWTSPHLCDVSKAEYITKPNWQSGLLSAEVNEDWQLPEVTPHLIFGDRMLSGGKIYS